MIRWRWISGSLQVAALTLFSLPAMATGKSPRQRLAARYGLVLRDGSTADTIWSWEEAGELLRFMDSMPIQLQTLPKALGLKQMQLYKGENALAPDPGRGAPSLLFWQMQIDLGTSQPSPMQVFPRQLLVHRFVHQLLHAYDAAYQASSEPAWRELSGWRAREYFGIKVPFLPRGADNQDPRAYAALSGQEDAEEDFVTYGEAFFTQSLLSAKELDVEDGMMCRTPEKFHYFQKRFADFEARQVALGRRAVQCKDAAIGLLDDIEFIDPVTKKPIMMGPINTATVEGFELLYATPGVGDAAEIAGHLLLRIRLRNGPRSTSDSENPHDLVMAFLADTEADQPPVNRQVDPIKPKSNSSSCHKSWFDFNLAEGGAAHQGDDFDALRAVTQSLKGLSGGFLTILDRQTLEQTVKSYTVDQDRNLLRYRLKLSPTQKQTLLARLYLAKKNYKTKYYFFDRNCASILVQLIGDGIGEKTVANFDPLVVPPNALVAMLVRQGLAEPVYPAFYGYRKQGQVAEEELKTRLNELARLHPDLGWPQVQSLLSDDEDTRSLAVAQLAKITAAKPALNDAMFTVLAFAQQAELVHADHTLRCDDYTSKPSAALRELQAMILTADPAVADRAGVDTNKIIYSRYTPTEEADSHTGSAHTNLSALSLGAGSYQLGNAPSQAALLFGTALHQQDLGSMSSQSMQRATTVTLGEVTAVAASHRLVAGRFTGLSLRKLKERLDQVPPWWEESGAFGLGLSVLDTKYDDDAVINGTHFAAVTSTLARGELLVNLASSRLYDRFMYLSVGGGLRARWDPNASGTREFDKHVTQLILPIRTEGLWTFDQQREWQLRAEVEERYVFSAGQIGTEWNTSVNLNHRLWEPAGTELLVHVGFALHSVDAKNATNDFASYTMPTTSRLLQLGLELDRW